MKKVSLLLAAFALVAGLSQCKKPNLPVINPGGTQHVVLNASWDNGGAKIDQNGTLFKWTIGDILTVSGGATGNLKCTDVTEGTFEGNIKRTSGENVTFTFQSANYKENFMGQSGELNDAVSLTGEVPYSTLGKCDVSMTMPHAVLKLDLSALGTTEGTIVTIKADNTDVASVKGVTKASTGVYVAVPVEECRNAKRYEFVSIVGSASCNGWDLKENTFYTLKNGEGEAIVVKPELLPGKFSVSATKYVQFSRGNLWYNTSENSWNLEANQTDFAKEVNVSHISHFYHCKGGSYGSALNYDNTWNIHEDVDWGVPYNAQHGGSLTTLSTLELNYILKERIVNGGTGIGKTCQFVTVNGTKGLIIYPDEYSGTFFTMEQEITDIPEGCVFLPLSGKRESTITELDGDKIKYWLSTSASGDGSNHLLAYPTTTCKANQTSAKSLAYSVRLVQKFEKPEIEPEFVDLGLPSGLLWANVNLGAKAETGPGSIGNYYFWGETQPWFKTQYVSSTSMLITDWLEGHRPTKSDDENSNVYQKYANMYEAGYIASNLTGEYAKYDAVIAKNWGARMPTSAEWEELWTKTKVDRSVTVDGIVCYKFTNKKDSGKYILLPTAGRFDLTYSYNDGSDKIYQLGKENQYWSSTSVSGDATKSYCFSGRSGAETNYSYERYKVALPIRAVKPRPVPAGFVDLGLSVFWAESNLDGYYQFGATTPNTGDWWNTTPFYVSGAGEDESWVFSKYNTVGAKLEALDDAAAVAGKGRIPSVAEWDELRTKCTWTWNGSGFTVKSNINGNSISLPANGNYGSFVGERGNYWANEVGGNNFDAHHLYFGTNEQPGAVSGKWNNRKEAFGIRPVHD